MRAKNNDSDIQKIKELIERMENPYPVSVVYNPEGVGVKELLEKVTDEIVSLLRGERYLLERYSWLWGNYVFETTKKKILEAIEEFANE